MPSLEPIAFHRTKYGPERLIDVAWIHEMPGFITDRPHVLAFWDVTLITGGRGWFALDGERHPLRRGAVLFSAPGQVREWNVQGLDGICLFFPAVFLAEFLADPSFLERLPFFAPEATSRALSLSKRAASVFRRRLVGMRRELRSLRGDSVELLRGRVYDVLVTLARHYVRRHGARRPLTLHPTVTKYRTLIEQNVRERHAVAWYAAKLGITAGHLNVLCREVAGKTAKALLCEALTLRARRLLRYSDESSAEIAHALGFPDPSYFTRFVRRTTGHPPSAIRSARVIDA